MRHAARNRPTRQTWIAATAGAAHTVFVAVAAGNSRAHRAGPDQPERAVESDVLWFPRLCDRGSAAGSTGPDAGAAPRSGTALTRAQTTGSFPLGWPAAQAVIILLPAHRRAPVATQRTSPPCLTTVPARARMRYHADKPEPELVVLNACPRARAATTCRDRVGRHDHSWAWEARFVAPCSGCVAAAGSQGDCFRVPGSRPCRPGLLCES